MWSIFLATKDRGAINTAWATSFFGAQGIGPADNCYRDSTQNMRPDGSVIFGRGDGATQTLIFTHSRSFSRDLNNSSSFAALCTVALRLLLLPHTTPTEPTTKDRGAINTTYITRALEQDAMKKGFCQVLKNSEYRVCCAQRHLPARGVGRTLNLLIRPSTWCCLLELAQTKFTINNNCGYESSQ